MSNMDPGRNPQRYQRESRAYTGWIIVAVAAIFIIAAIAYGMNDRSRTANTVPDTATGHSSPAPGSPPAGAPATNR